MATITNLVGDVTGSGKGAVTTTIANLAVTNAKIANATIDLTTKVTGALPIANGGTGQTTANPAFNALSPLTTKGDLLAFSTVNARLPVGADTFVLTADSTQTLGVKWSAAGSTSPVVAIYYCSTTQSTSTSLPINFDTQVVDTGSAVTTGSGWKFTAPSTGYYQVECYFGAGSGGASTWQIYKNGTQIKGMGYASSVGSTNSIGTVVINLNAGDYIDVRGSASVDVNGAALGSNASHIGIFQVRSNSSTSVVPDSQIVLYTGNATPMGSSATKIRRFATTGTNIGTGMTLTQNSTDGTYVTINTAGIYSIEYTDRTNSGTANFFGVSLNATGGDLTTDIGSLAAAKILQQTRSGEAGGSSIQGDGPCISVTARLAVNDVIRPHTDGSQDNIVANFSRFRITQLVIL